ncbi:hypothetical protein KSS87_022936, partial [Heliosperma pusillum]
LKIAYSPRGKGFDLRDFHYAVNRLPSDSYSPPFIEDSCLLCDLDISCLLSHELLYSAGQKDIDRKIVLISSCVPTNMESNIRKCLLDAADRCVSVEFVFLEQNSNQLGDVSESINKFREQICDLENCSFNAYLPGLTDNHSMKVDEHTLETKESWRSWMDQCPVSSAVYLNVTERTSLASLSEGVVVGKPLIVSASVSMEGDATDESDKCQLNNTSAFSCNFFIHLSQVLIIYLHEGCCCYQKEHITVPHIFIIFQGLCRGLYSLNQGLVCWTSCNIETMRETTFHYYYVLQPSDNELMLLRRLAVAEEILPFPDLNESDSSVTEEIDSKIQLCLREMELRDYNPVQHIGGFHHKINQLVHESLQSGPVNSDISITGSDITCHDCPAAQSSLAANVPTPVIRALETQSEIVDLTQEWEQLVDESGSTPKMNSGPSRPSSEKCLSEEWEQFIVGGDGRAMILVPPGLNMDKPSTSPTVTQKTLDTRTSKILERLGNPKQMKTKVTITSPTAAESLAGSRLDAGNQGLTTTSCLLKPTFQRLKRKQR